MTQNLLYIPAQMTFPLRIDILNKLQGKRDKPAQFWPIFAQFSGFFRGNFRGNFRNVWKFFIQELFQMSLWDPEAAGSAALWLRLPQEEMMAIQTSEYPGRNAVWVPFAETGYTKGLVQGDGEKAGTKKVLRSDGKEKEYKVSYHLQILIFQLCSVTCSGFDRTASFEHCLLSTSTPIYSIFWDEKLNDIF